VDGAQTGHALYGTSLARIFDTGRGELPTKHQNQDNRSPITRANEGPVHGIRRESKAKKVSQIAGVKAIRRNRTLRPNQVEQQE